MNSTTQPPELPPASSSSFAPSLDIPYSCLEVLVAVVAVIGNLLVLICFCTTKKARRRTNFYIASLAVADLFVGLLGIPFALMTSVGIPHNLHGCLFMLTLLVVLCVASIFCLVAVSADRYWAIVYPGSYARNMTKRTTFFIILFCWLLGCLVGFLPLLGWHQSSPLQAPCYFVFIMEPAYLAFLFFTTALTPSLIMIFFYTSIYRTISKQNKPNVTMMLRNTDDKGITISSAENIKKHRLSITKAFSVIVLFFLICWLPLQTINCINYYYHLSGSYSGIPLSVVNFSIILTHLNSAINPIIYAYHLKDFRDALKDLVCKILCIKDGRQKYADPQTAYTLPATTAADDESLE